MILKQLLRCSLILLLPLLGALPNSTSSSPTEDQCVKCGCLPKFPTHGQIIWDEQTGPVPSRTGTVICKEGYKLADEGVDHVACEREQWMVPGCVEGTAPDPPMFESYVLSLQWIPGVCEVEAGCNVSRQHDFTTWTIHGLWPDHTNFCKGDNFDSARIQGILIDLTTYWPSYKAGASEAMTDLAFWKYEYKKHGVCALSTNNINTELQYFTKALQLVKHYNLFTALDTAGIRPSNTTTYTKAAKDAALHKAFGPHQFKDKCVGKAGQQVLTEQRVCLDLEFNIVNCSSAGSCSGGLGIRYAPAPTVERSAPLYWIAIGVTVGVVLVLCVGIVLYKVCKVRSNSGPSEPYSTFNNEQPEL